MLGELTELVSAGRFRLVGGLGRGAGPIHGCRVAGCLPR